MKRKIILFTAFLISLCSYAQNDNILVETMLQQADNMGKKFIAKDYTGYLKYSYPRTVEVMGGEKQAVLKTTNEMEKFEEEGISFLSVKFGAPTKIIRVDNDLQSTLPQIIEMRVPEGKVTSTSTMIAISQNNGKDWYFLDTANYKIEHMKLLIPNLSDEISIPPLSDPSFEPDPKNEKKSE